ncbi:hypothetical protein O9G_006043 [Rozella allomycis CSF55]|uniref:Uncharacterized protein n=1 Tax=Rozella allomycis (strain CSF55) TaxID=988480 RepID=A0A075B1Q3_ROZAC|nr:hypothetical protein O9G_006043 [Rozella allomycis CSF55]|eukprot:EPZ36512.1 hypothetical protein O9G_006043 [Rozella allomycis CSF55]
MPTPIYFALTGRAQKNTAKSSTEAEYISLAVPTHELLWMNRLAGDLGCLISEPIIMNEDNHGVVKIIKSGTHQNRVKHLDIAYHIT